MMEDRASIQQEKQAKDVHLSISFSFPFPQKNKKTNLLFAIHLVVNKTMEGLPHCLYCTARDYSHVQANNFPWMAYWRTNAVMKDFPVLSCVPNIYREIVSLPQHEVL